MPWRRHDGNEAAKDIYVPCARRLLLACGLAVALIAPDASAIFIVNEPWVRLAPNGRSAEAYMNLTSTEGATLVGVRTEATASIEIRPPGTKRTTVSLIKLTAGENIELTPGGYRFVLASLNRPLKLGDRVAFVLTIEAEDGARTEIPVNAEVRLRSPTDDHRRGHNH
jgi:periplasmic copper chaperone A